MTEKCPICGKGVLDKEEDIGGGTERSWSCGHKTKFFKRGIIESPISVSDTVTVEVTRYLKKDVKELYEELAKLEQTQSQQRFAKMIDFEDRGKKIVEYFRDELQKKICVEFQYCEKIKIMKRLNDVALASQIASLIASLSHVLPSWIPATLISVILVKFGLSKFCNCN